MSRFIPVALLCSLLAACQVLTGLTSLELVDADVQSTSGITRSDAGSGEDGGVDRSPAADGGKMSCPPPHGQACDLITQCGCAPDQHCQALGVSQKPRCVDPGALEPGSVCVSSADCPRGQTCDDRVCRAYCKTDTDCKGGSCVAAHVSDPKSTGVNVCWTKCQVAKADACGPGARCRSLQPERGSKGNYCAAPADPCPTTDNGRCDESRGTGECVDGSDRRDCDCQPKLPDATCDLIEQCGCAKGSACFPVAGAPGGYSVTCLEWTGSKATGERCEQASECAPGQLCQFGRCTRLCDSDEQCAQGKCLAVDLASKRDANIRTCYQSCDRADPNSCSAGTQCAHFDQRFKVMGDFCIQPSSPCFESDRVCDEAAGSGICAPETDPVDCCKPSLVGGECNLLLQCGCEAKLGTSCVEVALSNGARTTACAAAGTFEVDHWCGEDSDCRAGTGCFGNICRKYCDADKDCQAGGRCIIAPRRGVPGMLKTCFGPCDPVSNAPCGSNTKCVAGTLGDVAASGCTLVLLTDACPKQNGRCDEPKGTGLCEQGYDQEDCT